MTTYSENNKEIKSSSFLPNYCFGVLPSTGEIIKIIRGTKGYVPLEYMPYCTADELNASIGVNKAQSAAMIAGSLFGWSCPAANPKNYDDNGKAIRNWERMPK